MTGSLRALSILHPVSFILWVTSLSSLCRTSTRTRDRAPSRFTSQETPTAVCLTLPESGGEDPIKSSFPTILPVPQAPPVCIQMLPKPLLSSAPTSSSAWKPLPMCRLTLKPNSAMTSPLAPRKVVYNSLGWKHAYSFKEEVQTTAAFHLCY